MERERMSEVEQFDYKSKDEPGNHRHDPCINFTLRE